VTQLQDLAKELRYKKEILGLMEKAYGSRTVGVLEAVRRAPKLYSVRANTLKTTSEDVIERLTAMGVRCSRFPSVDEAVMIEVDGPFQVERRGKQVVADKCAAESVMMGSKLYAPGVLRTDGYRVGDAVYITDIYDHLVGTGAAVLPPKVDKRKVRGMAVDVSESIYRLPPLRESGLYAEGHMREQSLPAMITSRVLDPQRGETVVDMCAAPGGKTLHMAQLMGCEGKIYAFDHSERRIATLMADAISLGITNVRSVCADSRYVERDYPALKADRVLVDPPCSALGVRPKLYEEAKASEVMGCARYQRQFMSVASRIVKEGGVIVYSTCTLTLEEDEEMVRFAVEELGLEPEDEPFRIGEAGFGGEPFTKAQRFSPDLVEMPGYFIAKFRRVRG
jgi:16S rRNA (cytosine967-C5)-methyltransferase